jgi:hypothetical protein
MAALMASVFRRVARYVLLFGMFEERLKDRGGLLVNQVQRVPQTSADQNCQSRHAVSRRFVDEALYFDICHVSPTRRLLVRFPSGVISIGDRP